MKRWPAVGVGLAGVWLFVRGVELDPMVILGEFIIGLGVGLAIAFTFRRFYLPELALGERVAALPAAAVYLTLFLTELVTANVDVAYRVLAPSMPIEPDVIELPLRVESDLAIATIANSITLTPGTLTMDYDDETNALYVHAIDGRDPEAIVAPIRTWEDYALRIFDEEGEPGDPAPRPTVGGVHEFGASGGSTDLTDEQGGDDDGE
jgi:multicomponent Na+:H+ antiporter subunit E